MTQRITSWSYSRLLDYEACPMRAKMKFIDRIPEQKHPAAERGTAIHLQAEQFVKGEIKKLPDPLKHFDEDLFALRDRYLEGKVSLEGEWGFDADWQPTDYKGAWLRMKGDAVVTLDPTQAIVIDYKTGQKQGNEIKHGEQVQLYAIASFLRQPSLTHVTVELWYIDKDEMTTQVYKRKEALRYVQVFDKRAKKMLDAQSFPANPTSYSCKYCPFSPAKGGQCSYGITTGQSPLKAYRLKFG